MIERGCAIITYNRADSLGGIIEGALQTVPNGCRVIVCDDGSTDNTFYVVKDFPVVYIRGPNLGVAYNKNRALYALNSCHYIALIEDDLKSVEKGWFEAYEEVSSLTNNHYFVRVQDKEVPETIPTFSEYLQSQGYTPIYGSTPRGDFIFLTSAVVRAVGGMNRKFIGCGMAHAEHAERTFRAGLISHPLRWMDLKECRDKFKQVNDTKGGRFDIDPEIIQQQINRNRKMLKKLKKTPYIYHPLVLE